MYDFYRVNLFLKSDATLFFSVPISHSAEWTASGNEHEKPKKTIKKKRTEKERIFKALVHRTHAKVEREHSRAFNFEIYMPVSLKKVKYINNPAHAHTYFRANTIVVFVVDDVVGIHAFLSRSKSKPILLFLFHLFSTEEHILRLRSFFHSRAGAGWYGWRVARQSREKKSNIIYVRRSFIHLRGRAKLTRCCCCCCCCCVRSFHALIYCYCNFSS